VLGVRAAQDVIRGEIYRCHVSAGFYHAPDAEQHGRRRKLVFMWIDNDTHHLKAYATRQNNQ
jgi:hypothetical protein